MYLELLKAKISVIRENVCSDTAILMC